MLTALVVAIAGIGVSNLSVVGASGKPGGEGSSLLSHALFITGALAALTFLVLVVLTVRASIQQGTQPRSAVRAPDDRSLVR